MLQTNLTNDEPQQYHLVIWYLLVRLTRENLLAEIIYFKENKFSGIGILVNSDTVGNIGFSSI